LIAIPMPFGLPKIRAVEGIEELRLELELMPLGGVKVLEQREVEVPLAGVSRMFTRALRNGRRPGMLQVTRRKASGSNHWLRGGLLDASGTHRSAPV